MSRLTKEMKEYLSMAKDAGLTVLSHTRHRNHMKIRVEAPSGEQSIIVAPVSVSDWRGRKNLKAHMARVARSETPSGQHRSPKGDSK